MTYCVSKHQPSLVRVLLAIFRNTRLCSLLHEQEVHIRRTCNYLDEDPNLEVGYAYLCSLPFPTRVNVLNLPLHGIHMLFKIFRGSRALVNMNALRQSAIMCELRECG